MKYLYFFFFAATLVVVSCKNQNTSTTEENVQEETPVQSYEITPFEPSKDYPGAAITDMSFQNGTFNFTLSESEYELGAQTPDAANKMCANSGQGQHIHLIIDDAPYAAKYTSSFEYEIENGDHYLLAFLSRSYHESIKTEEASVAKKVSIQDNSITEVSPIDGPMLFYSRPKGTYIGTNNTKKVMLDFYPVNVTLGNDFKVRANINGEDYTLDKWQPYYIEGLPMGENTITLTLVDKDGNTVDTPLNPVTRKFTLKKDPTENM